MGGATRLEHQTARGRQEQRQRSVGDPDFHRSRRDEGIGVRCDHGQVVAGPLEAEVTTQSTETTQGGPDSGHRERHLTRCHGPGEPVGSITHDDLIARQHTRGRRGIVSDLEGAGGDLGEARQTRFEASLRDFERNRATGDPQTELGLHHPHIGRTRLERGTDILPHSQHSARSILLECEITGEADEVGHARPEAAHRDLGDIGRYRQRCGDRTDGQPGIHRIGRVVVGHGDLRHRHRGEGGGQRQHRSARGLHLHPALRRQQQCQFRILHTGFDAPGGQERARTLGHHLDVIARLREPEVALQRHKPTQRRLEPGHQYRGRIGLNLQWRAHRADRHAGIHRVGGVVVGHGDLRDRDRGERCGQGQHRGTRGLQLHSTLRRQHHRQLRPRHADGHATGGQQRARTLGHHLDVIARLREPEVALQRHESAERRFEPGRHHSGRVGPNRQRGTHRADRHAGIHRVGGIVVGHGHLRDRDRGEGGRQGQHRRTGSLQLHPTLGRQHQRQLRPRHTHLDATGGQQRTRTLGHHLDVVALLPEAEIAPESHKPAHLGAQSLHRHHRGVVDGFQRRTDCPSAQGDGQHTVLIDSGVVEHHRHGGGRGAGKPGTQRQIHRTRGLQRQLLVAPDQQRQRGVLDPDPDG